MHLFRKKKTTADPNAVINRLRDTLEMLEKREIYLQKKSEAELAVAKKHATVNKRAAMFALKKRRVYDSQIEKMTGARMTLETQILNLEQAQMTRETMLAMEAGAQAMSDIHGNISIDQAENMIEDLREQMEIGEELSSAISTPIGIDFDDDELLAELSDIQQTLLDESLLGMETVAVPKMDPARISLPNVPQRLPMLPSARTTREDDEFARLAAEMAI
eukprot:TRINITY_DN2891_c0_g1_i2.p2 TRINITY_DN2891_c0_g1~~TRINITY_DN2891_c0_g1_i2.p2  ORF type:complete len:219 (+),score=55.93 TRINITY_DN2891_c0_g1_i2:65-721(+)